MKGEGEKRKRKTKRRTGNGIKQENIEVLGLGGDVGSGGHVCVCV